MKKFSVCGTAVLILAMAGLSGCSGADDGKNDKFEKPLTPVMGWSSWNNFGIDISENLIREHADILVSSGLKDAGYVYLNIDDGYFGGRDAEGNLLSHPEKFPSGMGELAEYIHSKGLRAGIYSDAGKDTCASMWGGDEWGRGAGLYGHEENDLGFMLDEWDYDFIKIDWCGGQALKLDDEERYTELGEIIYAIKPQTVYNVCRWMFPGAWVLDAADSWRVSGDITSDFSSIKSIIEINSGLWKYSGGGHFNDMDMLQVGRGMSIEEDRTHFTMWCMMNSPLLLGNDLRALSDETLELVSNPEVIAVNQDPFTYQARRFRDDGDTELWARPLGSLDSGTCAVALLNYADTAADVAFSPLEAGIDGSAEFTLRDLWARKEVPYSASGFTVPGHGVRLILVTGKALANGPY